MARCVRPGPLLAVAAALSVLLSATPGRAQTRLYLLLGDECAPSGCASPRVLEIDVEGRRLLATTPVHAGGIGVSGPVVTADGRYLAWLGAANGTSSPTYLAAFDTGSRTQIPLLRTSEGANRGVLLADPGAVRLYGRFQFERDEPITVLEPQATRELPVPCPIAALTGISGDGARLAVECYRSPLYSLLVVVDSVTGRECGSVPAATFNVLDDRGTQVYGAWESPIPGEYEVYLDRSSLEGQGVTRTLSVWGLPGPMRFDGRTRRLYLGLRSAGQMYLGVFDGDNLGEVARLPAPAWEYAGARLVVDPDHPLVYVHWGGSDHGSPRSRLVMYETETFTAVAEADLGSASVIGMVLGPRPPRATGLMTTVTGNTVRLQWALAGSHLLTTGFVVEAGSETGLANLAVLRVEAGQTTLTAPNVPRGTYYVRVRSVNGTGVGEPSNEVMVEIP